MGLSSKSVATDGCEEAFHLLRYVIGRYRPLPSAEPADQQNLGSCFQQIETVSAYARGHGICSGGAVLRGKDVRFDLGLHRVSRQIVQPNSDGPLKLICGFHSGKVLCQPLQHREQGGSEGIFEKG
jgi:hypothetical protein